MTKTRGRTRVVPSWFREPIVEFFETGASGGIVLIVATVVALVWANTPWAHTYHDFWHTKITLGWGAHKHAMSLHHWINDGLMAIFFFFVGLEIKRELLTGELATWRKAALPAMGALGGMVVPALAYTALNLKGAGSSGWGIPMATDIAFAIGILMLLGKRVPLGLKVFLTALAVVDDLGAVLVIAIFYTAELATGPLMLGMGLLVLMAVLSRLGMRRRLAFVGGGIVVWVCFLESGVHATVAGVLLAFTVPHRIDKDRPEFLSELDQITDELWDRDKKQKPITDHTHIVALQRIREISDKAGSPLQHMEHELAPWVAYGVMPLFALANAGVAIDGAALVEAFRSPVPLGIMLGLVLGKQIGIFGFSWLAVRMGWAGLPRGVTWRSLHGAALLGGIGFTMSLFIATLALAEELLDPAKMGILGGSLICAVLGTLVLLRAPVPPPEAEAAPAPAPAPEEIHV